MTSSGSYIHVCERDRDYISKENFPQILIYPSLTFFSNFIKDRKLFSIEQSSL